LYGPPLHTAIIAKATDTIRSYAKQTNQPAPCAPNNTPHATTSAPSLPAAPGVLAFTLLSSMPPVAQPTKQTTHSARSALNTSPLSRIQPNQPHKMRPWNPRSNPTRTRLLLTFPLCFSDGMMVVLVPFVTSLLFEFLVFFVVVCRISLGHSQTSCTWCYRLRGWSEPRLTAVSLGWIGTK
jgi:hypothetical protein